MIEHPWQDKAFSDMSHASICVVSESQTYVSPLRWHDAGPRVPPWSPGLVTALGVTPVMPGPALSPAQPPSSSLIPELCSVSSLQLSSVPQPRPLRHHLIISTSHAISSDFIRVDILNYKWLRMCVCEWVSQVRLRVNWWILAVTNHLMSVKWN